MSLEHLIVQERKCSKTNGDMSKNTEAMECSNGERNPQKRSLHSGNWVHEQVHE